MKITEYTVKYRLVGDFFWKHVKNVVGDDTVFRSNRGGEYKERPGEDTLPVRVLYLKDGGRVELPLNNVVIVFPKERFQMIEEAIKEGKG